MTETAPTDVVELLAELVAIDTTNPSLVPGARGGGGRPPPPPPPPRPRRLASAGLTVDTWDAAPGRPNIVARLRGSGGGRSLMLCGHLDVVGGEPELFRPTVREGRMYGRGTVDMKGGVAAMVVAAQRLAARSAGGQPLRGDLLVAGIIDEEWESLGATALLDRYRADAAVLAEQSDLDVITEHGGFVWFEVESRGGEAAGRGPGPRGGAPAARPAAHGVDAIALLGPVLDGVRRLDRVLAQKTPAAYGRPSVHASTITGGVTYPAYPASCTLGVERCLIPGETVSDAEAELRSILDAAGKTDGRFDGTARIVVGRDPVRLDPEEAVVAALIEAARAGLGRPVTVRGDLGWMDSGILVEGGVPCVIFGPTGGREHTADEWVDLASVETSARVYERLAELFCA
jgi:acetylornithine deacetylase